MQVATACRNAFVQGAVVLAVLASVAATPAAAAELALPATDAGFVTEAGGSAKGDGTVVSAATYNYSAGFELHYGTGALFAPLAPMFRKNYFVFDLSPAAAPIVAAKLVLWTGTLETADAFELYVLKETTDMPAAVGLEAALAAGAGPADFDSPSDPLVMAAAALYAVLGDGTLTLGGIVLTPAADDSFVEITLGPAALAYLSAFAGGPVVLGGLVPSAEPPAFPQQPFGFTGPDLPGGDPKTPLLVVTTIPEPATVALWLCGLLALAGRAGPRRRAAAAGRR